MRCIPIAGAGKKPIKVAKVAGVKVLLANKWWDLGLIFWRSVPCLLCCGLLMRCSWWQVRVEGSHWLVVRSFHLHTSFDLFGVERSASPCSLQDV